MIQYGDLYRQMSSILIQELYAVCSMHDLRDETSRARLVCDYVCHFASQHVQSVMQGYPNSKEAIFFPCRAQPAEVALLLGQIFREFGVRNSARGKGTSVGARSCPLFRWNRLKKRRECIL